jgi:hypothetical protein
MSNELCPHPNLGEKMSNMCRIGQSVFTVLAVVAFCLAVFAMPTRTASADEPPADTINLVCDYSTYPTGCGVIPNSCAFFWEHCGASMTMLKCACW